MLRTLKTTLAASLLCVAPLCAVAQTQAQAQAEEGGQVDITIGEDSYVFPLLVSESDWSGSENFTSVNLHTSPTDDETRGRFKTFVIGFEYLSGAVNNPEIRLERVQDDGSEQELFGEDEQGDVVVTVDSISVDDGMLKVAGKMSGSVGPSDNSGFTIDLSEPVEVSGSFDVVLGPAY